MNFRPCFPRQAVAEQFHFGSTLHGSGLRPKQLSSWSENISSCSSYCLPLVSQPQAVLTPLHWSRKCTFQASWTLCLLSYLSHSLQGPAQAPLHPDHLNPRGPLPALKLGVPCLCFSDNFIEVLLWIAVDLCFNGAGLPVPVITSLKVEPFVCTNDVYTMLRVQ